MPVVNQSSGIKAGTVSHFAASTAPAGWIKANGALISRSAYAALFTVIGTTFGAGDGSTTFALPDLRGQFLRCFDDGKGIDSGRVIGSSQADDNKSHSHSYSAPAYSDTGAGGTGAGYYTGLTTGSSGGSESRPKNIALLACIKY